MSFCEKRRIVRMQAGPVAERTLDAPFESFENRKGLNLG
jgi:hypothetical protein